MKHLVDVIQKLSLARTVNEVVEITRHAARELTGADGATFVLKDGDFCHYVDEDAVSPLWKGKRFPLHQCVSGWAMIHKEAVVIPDIFKDARVPVDAYSPTFVKSLAMIPIREASPIGAIGNYWATPYTPTPEQIEVLKMLANSTSIALENIRLIDDLKYAKQSLENSLHSRDEFLAVISHELRTPLTVLKLQLQMADREAVKSKSEIKTLSMAVKQSDSLNRLIEKLLDFSRIQLGRLDLHYSDLNFSHVVKDSLDTYLPQLEAAGCRVETQFNEKISGEWDKPRIQQLVGNLLLNVCKYAPESDVKISTSIDTLGAAVLEISDNGPGIKPEVLSRIFDRFERGYTSNHISGLGLGLFISKHIVSGLKGNIRAASEPGQLTRFTVELPLSRIQPEVHLA